MRLRLLTKFVAARSKTGAMRLICRFFSAGKQYAASRLSSERSLCNQALKDVGRPDRESGDGRWAAHPYRVARAVAVAALLFGAPSALAQTPPLGAIASVEQVGDGAIAQVEHIGGGNVTRVGQSGDNLSAQVRIEGAGNSGVNGAGNSVEQTGSGASLVASIVGDNNAFEVIQEGGDLGAANNDAIVDVVGDFNNVVLHQLNASGGAYFNTAAVRQVGDGNFAEVMQEIDPRELSSGGLSATIDQEGTDHIARIQQAGADNTAALSQRGSSNLGTILQDGEGLSANLVQNGVGLDYTINQTGCVVGTGCGTITVTQTGGP